MRIATYPHISDFQYVGNTILSKKKHLLSEARTYFIMSEL